MPVHIRNGRHNAGQAAFRGVQESLSGKNEPNPQKERLAGLFGSGFLQAYQITARHRRGLYRAGDNNAYNITYLPVNGLLLCNRSHPPQYTDMGGIKNPGR